jgi:hypothetical protein
MVAVAARPEILRPSGISNFTATLQSSPVPVSHSHGATSTIIERIWNDGYELWNPGSAFWDVILAMGRGFGSWVSLRELADFVVGLFLK